jgi:hypothetical protein
MWSALVWAVRRLCDTENSRRGACEAQQMQLVKKQMHSNMAVGIWKGYDYAQGIPS